MKSEKMALARQHLEAAIRHLDEAHSVWSECVTAMHMAEIKLRSAQKRVRQCYTTVTDALNGDGG